MSERRFLITELEKDTSGFYNSKSGITEAELKRRLSLIQYESVRSSTITLDDQIDILVYGERGRTVPREEQSIDRTRPYLKITKEQGMQIFPETKPTRTAPMTGDDQIDILVYGGLREQPPPPEADYQKALLTIASYDSGDGCCRFGCDCPTIAKEVLKIGRVTEKEQPLNDPKPTRKEWSRWAYKIACALVTDRFGSYENQRDFIDQILMDMPGVPKE